MAHVFISYKRNTSNKRFVNKMKKYLKEAGFESWIDTEKQKAGEDWREAIDQAIKDALAVIVVLTPEAVASQYVTYEWAFAFGVGKRVIPVLYKQTDLHPRFAGKHYLDFMGRGAHPWRELTKGLQAIQAQLSVEERMPASLKPTYDALNSSNALERKEAVRSLSQSNNSVALEILISALKHDFLDVRPAAAEVLGKLRKIEAIPALIEGLCDPNSGIRGEAETALIQIGHKAIPQLAEALDHRDDMARKEIVVTLVHIQHRDAVPHLVKALRDPYPEVREKAASGLGEIGNADVVPDLLDAAHDENQEVRFRVIQALTKIGDPRAIPIFLEAVPDKYDHIWKAALEGLAAFHDPSVAPVLAARLMHFDARKKCEIISVLGHLGETSIVPDLIKYLRDESPGVRKHAAWALGELRDKRAIPSLIEVLDDPDNDVLENATNALRMVTMDDIPVLLAELGSGSERVQKAIEFLLKHMKYRGEQPEEHIKSFCQNENRAIRDGADIALGILKKPGSSFA